MSHELSGSSILQDVDHKNILDDLDDEPIQ